MIWISSWFAVIHFFGHGFFSRHTQTLHFKTINPCTSCGCVTGYLFCWIPIGGNIIWLSTGWKFKLPKMWTQLFCTDRICTHVFLQRSEIGVKRRKPASQQKLHPQKCYTPKRLKTGGCQTQPSVLGVRETRTAALDTKNNTRLPFKIF